LPQGARGSATVSRADVAHFLLDEVEHPAHVRRVVGMAHARHATMQSTPETRSTL
jgi:putative NADH-flavin reductase